MEAMPADDPRSMGQLNVEYLRARIRSLDETRRFAGIEGLELDDGARAYAGTRQADDVVWLSAIEVEGRPIEPGRYFVDYKAGDEAFNIEQAVRYARALDDDPEFEGILYIFTGRNPRRVTDPTEAGREAARSGREAARAAQLSIARSADIPHDRRHRFIYAYIDEHGAMQWP